MESENKKLWAGRTDAQTDKTADELNSSFSVDRRLFRQDIAGSIAHTDMLSSRGIIGSDDAEKIKSGLSSILSDIESGSLALEGDYEDIHTFNEQILTERIGSAGKKLHTARSRNDQVALDMRLFCREMCDVISSGLKELVGTIADKAEQNKTTLMPGFTHMQHAQPVTFGFHILAYAMMFLRDIDRLSDCRKRINVSPIGSCALAGTTYDTDRYYEADALGFSGICMNAADGVSDRDHLIELLSCLSTVMMHLSRFSEEIIIWSSQEFGFIELSDGYTTGSSIMPQKKNPDMAELCRGKTGRVYGDLITLLTVMKGLPLAYDKDMQEDKEPVFDAVDTVVLCLEVFNGMLRDAKINGDAMTNASRRGFMNATDLADYYVRQGLPFREAYKLCGQIVSYCSGQGITLEELSLDEYKAFCSLTGEDVYDAIDLFNCMNRRNSVGGTSVSAVDEQISYVRNMLK